MSSSEATAPTARAGRREWIGLGVLTLPTLLLALDLSVLYLALPQLSTDLDADGTQQLWITDIYGFMIAGFLVTMGTLGDRVGRRKLLLIGATAFGLASAVAAYSTSAEMLIVTRALLGIAGATLMPSTLALISNMFRDAKQRSTAIAAWMTCFVAGMALGPIIGGVLLEHFWWGSVFLLGVPVMVVLLVAGPILLPEYRDTSAGRIDLVSVALSLLAILPIVYGLKQLAKDGWAVPPVAALVVGAVFGVLFGRRQRRIADPVLDLKLFTNRSFTAALTIMLGSTLTMGGSFLFITLYLQIVEGLSPLKAGLWLIPGTVVVAITSMLAPLLVTHIRPGYVTAGGLLLSAVGLGIITQVNSTDSMPLLVVGMVVMNMGMGPIGALCTNLVVSSAPPEKAGSASSVSETSGEFGIAMGVAIFGSIGVAVYRDQLAENMPDGVSAAVAESAREGIGGASAAAAELPGTLGAQLLGAARDAYTDGLTVNAGIGAVLFVILAAVAVTLLRHVPAGHSAPDAHGVSNEDSKDEAEDEPARV